ncbi:hypothetical protein KDA_61680 [Dictyobacter alpinus]|uniref:Aminoglycoside phosphotransferase domain-containing protein n=1 Tax=Dictyobacter alpinus TaxID=2014873 RepID=A0A402BGY6_9CHLR|nr:aminoglycoside phosphotransferase family protein [Dictyobacter alpinus]GCE30684.1 hypothetical protein KDA_61680 [Dictyobacter alpinus]
MKYSSIQRPPDAFQRFIQPELLETMCQRAFGDDVQIEAITELAGGLYNNTYLIERVAEENVVLRVGPDILSDPDSKMMRNELAAQPFFAPIAPLLPRTIMADFTQQLINRDYIFQSFMPGEQWESIKDELTTEQNEALWRQLGSILKQIHAVRGTNFGSPYPFPLLSRWSLAVFNWLEQTIIDVERAQLDATDLNEVLAIARKYADILDEIKRPSLLHGDLWTVNVLVVRTDDPTVRPTISAILDADRCSWGDPLADWTMFLFRYHRDAEAPFWQSYGRPKLDRAAQFRSLIYAACFIGGARLEYHRHHHPEKVEFSYTDMQSLLAELNSVFLSGALY